MDAGVPNVPYRCFHGNTITLVWWLAPHWMAQDLVNLTKGHYSISMLFIQMTQMSAQVYSKILSQLIKSTGSRKNSPTSWWCRHQRGWLRPLPFEKVIEGGKKKEMFLFIALLFSLYIRRPVGTSAATVVTKGLCFLTRWKTHFLPLENALQVFHLWPTCCIMCF